LRGVESNAINEIRS